MDEQVIAKTIYHPGGPLTDQNQLLGRTSLYNEDGTPLSVLSSDQMGLVVTSSTGDGTTNDLEQFRIDLADSAGGKLIIPAGNFRLSVSSSNEQHFAPAANTHIVGAGPGRTVLEFEATDTGYHPCVGLNADNVTFENITFRRTTDFDMVMFKYGSGLTVDNVKFINCTFDVNRTALPLAAYAHALEWASTGTFTNLNLIECSFINGSGLLKANASTSTVRGLRVERSRFNESGVAMNAPNSTFEDVVVTGCVIENSMFGMDLAHIENAVLSDNIIRNCGEGLHIEDFSSGVTISGNVFDGCNVTVGPHYGIINIMDSNTIAITGNTFLNPTAIVSEAMIFINGSVLTTPTAGGRNPQYATKDITVTGNTLLAGPNLAIMQLQAYGVNISGNLLSGDLSISDTYVESGTQTKSGISLFGGADVNISSNTIKGFRYGIGRLLTSAAKNFSPGTVIAGNIISNCRVGIQGSNPNQFVASANTIRRCITPAVVGASRSGSAGNALPYIVNSNNFLDNKTRAAIDGVLVVVATGSATIGTGVTLNILPAFCEFGTAVVRFSGGGVLTPTTGVGESDSLITGNLATANIAAGEVGVVVGWPDIPYTTPFTLNNRIVKDNIDSSAPIPVYDRVAVPIYIGNDDTLVPTGVASTFRLPFGMQNCEIQASLATTGSGDVVFQLLRGATDQFTSNITIFAGQKTSRAFGLGSPTFINNRWNADDEITVSVSNGGTTARGLKIWVTGNRRP
jgi:hypothetical protein